MTAPGPLLYPNLGGEEGPGSPALDPASPTRAVARLWSVLFGERARLLATEPDGDEPRAWPEALGPPSAAPAWPWLPDAGGVPWLPTEPAERILEERGAPSVAVPAEIVQLVHDKAFAQRHVFAAGLEDELLAPALRCYEPEALADPAFPARLASELAAWPRALGDRFALKPRFGSTGRGRADGDRPDGSRPELGERVRRSLPRLARRGGAVLEPWLPRLADYSVQFLARAGGDVELLGSTRQLVRPSGVVRGGCGTFDAAGRPCGGTRHDEPLAAAALSVARAAAAEGFVGAAGVDAFSWRGPDGRPRLRAIVELNARFTTGTIAFGLLARAREAGLLDDVRAWALLLAGPPPLVPGGWRVLRLLEGAEAPILLLGPSEALLDELAPQPSP